MFFVFCFVCFFVFVFYSFVFCFVSCFLFCFLFFVLFFVFCFLFFVFSSCFFFRFLGLFVLFCEIELEQEIWMPIVAANLFTIRFATEGKFSLKVGKK